MNARLLSLILIVAMLCGVAACDIEFDPASKIDSLRFLGIVADPIEAAPGEQITFRAIVTNKNGTQYTGPVAWAILSGDQARLTGDVDDIDIGDFYLQPSPDAPFVWTVPAVRDLQTEFGPLQSRGLLLTIGATVFEDGDLDGEPRAAFKLFVVSERDPADRIQNPVLENVNVTAGGQVLNAGDQGEFVTSASKVKLTAQVDEKDRDQTFHWFATTDDFEPNFQNEQTLDPDKKGRYGVYCIVRESFYFAHDNNSRTRVTGQDYWQGFVRFE